MAISPFSLALWADEKTQFELTQPVFAWDIENLILDIRKFLTSCHYEIENLTKIVVALGPGGYTSLRLSVTTLKTIAMVHQIEMIGFPTLDALAFPFRHQSGVHYVITPGKKEDVNAALFTTSERRLVRQSESIVWPFETCVATLKRCEEPFMVIGQFPDALKDCLLQIPNARLIERCLNAKTLIEMSLEGYPGESTFEFLQPIYGHVPTLGPLKV